MEVTLEQWAMRRKAYLDAHPCSIEAIDVFCVWWDSRVRKADIPTMPTEVWNHYFLDYLLCFHL